MYLTFLIDKALGIWTSAWWKKWGCGNIKQINPSSRGCYILVTRRKRHNVNTTWKIIPPPPKENNRQTEKHYGLYNILLVIGRGLKSAYFLWWNHIMFKKKFIPDLISIRAILYVWIDWRLLLSKLQKIMLIYFYFIFFHPFKWIERDICRVSYTNHVRLHQFKKEVLSESVWLYILDNISNDF